MTREGSILPVLQRRLLTMGRHGILCVLVLLLAGGTALAKPQAISLPPHAERVPAPLLHRPDARIGNADSLTIMCLEYFALGNLHVAQEACSEALALDPKRVDALKLRGYAYLLEGRYEEAASDFRTGLRIHPADDQFFGGLGQSFSNMGDYGAAADQFHKALALAPGKAAYWNGLCWARGASGEMLNDALEACNRAIRLEPNAAAPYNSRGLVRLRLRRFLEAAADYSHALQLNPEQPSARFGRGLAKLWASDKEGASDVRAARQMDPGVDDLFMRIGLLPDRCEDGAKKSCPPGFPLRPIPNRTNNPIAKLLDPNTRELLRMGGIFL
ncbi:MAG: tetratricopeptide repeat protein [Rhizomicrobium sp.]